MSIKEKLKAGGSKVVGAGMSVVLAVGLMPLPAFANVTAASSDALTTSSVTPSSVVTTQDDDSTGAKSADGLVIAAAYAAAEPAPELLGLSNPNYRSSDEATNIAKIFGDDTINESVDPYAYNHKNGKTPGAYIGGRGGSPMSALNAYSTTDSTAAQNAVWEIKPHIILGTGSDDIPDNEHDFYDSSARIVEGVLGQDAYTYNPIGVTYNRVNLNTMIATMYRFAEAAQEAIDNDSSINIRYTAGPQNATYKALDWAKLYEKYITGAKGYVKMAIDKGIVNQKTIALVQSYDSSSGTYTIIPEGVAEGTATTNRFLEAVQGVSTNYFSKIQSSAPEGAKVADDGKTATVTASLLKNNVDVILLGGQASTDSATLSTYLRSDGLLDRTFYCSNMSSGSVFGVTVNSVENAQNVGRILPCVYPELLDQSDMVAFYYDNFYHLKENALGSTIDTMMDGVRNWNQPDSASYLTWSASDVADYDENEVMSILETGIAYLNSIKSSTSLGVLAPTDYMSGVESPSLAKAEVTASAAVLTDGTATPELTVTYGGNVLTKDKDYTVEYSNNTAVGTGSYKISPASGSVYTGSKTGTFTIVAENNFTDTTVTVADIAAETYTGGAITPEPSVTLTSGSAALTKGTDYTVSYSNNVNAGTATVTLKGLGAYAGTVTKDFSINKMTPKVTAGITEGEEFKTSFSKSYGDEFALEVTSDGDGTLSYTSSNDSVAKIVNGSIGIVASSGTATITVTSAATGNCESATATVSVTAQKLTPTISVSSASKNNNTGAYSINLTYLADAVELGASVDKIYTTATGKDYSTTFGLKGEGGTLTYQSSDENVVKVETATIVSTDRNGNKTEKRALSPVAKGAGTATLTVTAPATTNCEQATFTATVTVAKGSPKITLPATSISKTAGDEDFSLGATYNGDGTVEYTSGNPNVATIVEKEVTTGEGDDATTETVPYVHIVGAGTSVILIQAMSTDNCKMAYALATVTVSALTPDIKSTAKFTKTYGNAAFSLGATVDKDYRADGGILSYSSDKESVATVDSKGKVTIKGVGTAKITISAPATGKYAAKTATSTVTVNGMAPTITASNKSVKMGVTTTKVGASVNSKGTITYSSNKTSVAKVDALKGVITPVGVGTATITVKAAAKGNYAAASKTITVTVTQGSQSLAFSNQSKTLAYSKVKSKAQTIAITKASGAKTTVTYSITGNTAAKKYFTINSKTGVLTAKKGTPKTTYKVAVKATAAKTNNWADTNKSATITVKVI